MATDGMLVLAGGGVLLVACSEIFGRDELQHLFFFYLVGFTQDSQIPGEVVTGRALRWLENRSRKPFFARLHYCDPPLSL